MNLLRRLVIFVLIIPLLAPTARAQTIPNPSFETDHYFSGVGYASQNGGVIAGWTMSDPSHIGLNLGGTNNPGLLVDNGAIPNGANVAFIQCNSGSKTNTLSTFITGLTPGTTYLVSFRANCRDSGYTFPNATWSLNGDVFVPFICSPPVLGGNPYYTNSATFTATSPTAALVLRNGIASGDGAVLVDNFTVAPVVLAQPAFGAGLKFDGISTYVSVTNFGSILPTNEITIEFWANATTAKQQLAFILQPINLANLLSAYLPFSDSKIYWDFGNIFSTGRVSVPFPLASLTNWTHYAFLASQSGNFMKIYTNGNLLVSSNYMTPFVPGIYELRIGGSPSAGVWNGLLDDFRVWNTARSQGQIQANLGTRLLGIEPNLVAYYRFDQRDGSIATNYATATGAPYDGVLVNGPVWALANLTLPATGVTTNSAKLNGIVHPGILGTSYFFQYGPTTNYGSTTTIGNVEALTDTAPVAVSSTLNGLTPYAIYHFRIVTSNNVVGTYVGADQAFIVRDGWIPLVRAAPSAIGHMMLLPDGSVMAQDKTILSNWFKLTPDDKGSYVNGTWTNLASMSFTRLFFSSQVLQNGKVMVAGGEYGTGGTNSEIYDPLANTWTPVSIPPSLYAGNPTFNIFDANSILLPNGKMLVAPVYSGTNFITLLYDPVANTWTNGPSTLRGQDESTWVKLPDGSIITIGPTTNNFDTVDRFIPSLNKWVTDRNTPIVLYSLGEIGPGVLLPDGRAFVIGGTTNTAFYTPSGTTNNGAWTVGPTMPDSQMCADTPAAMLVNGNMLIATAPFNPTNSFPKNLSMYEFNPRSQTFTPLNTPTGGLVDTTQFATSDAMLCLPDGSVLLSLGLSSLYVYRPIEPPIVSGIPTIRSIAQNAHGSLHLTGLLFNGISMGATFGDDLQMDSNYPLVRFTDANGTVRYGRTHNWSSTSVQTGTNVVTTECTIPEGASLQDNIEVVANGIASPQLSYPIALDTAGFTWASGDFAIWGIQTNVTHDGVDAVQSGAILSDQFSSLTTTVSGPGALTFWWKVSSEPIFDLLRFYLDGREQTSIPGISGEVDWQQRIVPLPEGAHTLTWTYSKDFDGSDGADAGWLDQVVFISSVVTTANDGGAGSLRDVLAAVPPGSTISFGANLSGRTIALTNGQIALDKNIAIDAFALAGGLTISGNNASRAFLINPGVTSILSGLTITGGNGAGPAPIADYGGAIFNQGNLTLNNCYVTGNRGYVGGGIFNSSGNRLTLHGSTLATNSASYGGAIQNEGILFADNTTFNANAALQQGGAISAPFSWPVALLQCTVSGNNGGDGGGVLGNNIAITNSIVAGNTATINPDLGGSVTAGGNNLTNGNPLLSELANYGGPTPTMRPLIGSPAIDAGDDVFASGLSFDQRGRARTVGSSVDIGAVELNPNALVTTVADSGPGSLRLVVANLEPGFAVTFSPALSGQTIGLSTGSILLDRNLTIDGSASGVKIDGNNASRIFFVNSGVNATLNGLILANGAASQGGAIQNLGTLTLNQCTLTGNRDSCVCGINGGAVLNRSRLIVNNTTFMGNTAAFGGAIFNDVNSTLTVSQSTFNANVGTNGGGAIYNFNGTMSVFQSTIVGNQSPGGGSQGGGINNSGFGLFLTNSIVCNNTASSSPNIAGVVTPLSSPNNLVDANALLAPLADSGGPTLTMLPLAGSPALNAGNDAAAASFATDQRGVGFPRISGAHVDIGAVEYQLLVVTNAPILGGLTVLGNGTFRFAFTDLIGGSFSVFAATNLALPFNQWSNLGAPVESPAGTFTFTDLQATNNSRRFYRVSAP